MHSIPEWKLPLDGIADLTGAVLRQECKPLILRGSDGEQFDFRGVDTATKGTVDANSLLASPHMAGGKPFVKPANVNYHWRPSDTPEAHFTQMVWRSL